MTLSARSVAPLAVSFLIAAAGSWWASSQRHRFERRQYNTGQTQAGREDRTQSLEASGTVEGTLVRIASRLPGKVARVLVDEGDPVAKGQQLLELEDQDTRAEVDQARARLANTRARLEEALAGTRRESLRQAEAELARATALRMGAADAVRNLESQWANSTELKQSVEAAESQVAATRATLEVAVAHLSRLKVGARPDAVLEAEAAVAGARATADRAAAEEDRLRRAYEEGAIAQREWNLAQTERDVAAANLTRARAHLADLLAGARPEEIREAEQQVAAARAAHEGARASLANARRLYRDRLPARERLDAARAELRQAASAVAAARAHLELLRRGTRAEVVQQLRAQLAEARAALGLAEWHQRELRIRSPVGGRVTDRYVQPGEVVQPGIRLLQLEDMRTMWVRVYLSENGYGRVRVGERVTVTTDSLPDQVFTGRVSTIAREAEYTPRSVQTKEERVNLMFAIRVEVENRAGALLIGMPVDVQFAR
jgi:HlyD family secretion protein